MNSTDPAFDEAFDRLPAAARAAWGKHDRPTDDWLPLWRHMADSGAVAGRLWDVWLPHNVKVLVSEALPGGIGDGRKLAVWLAASHDVGKATPAFACQVEPLANAMRDIGLAMPYEKQFGEDRTMGPHGLAGQLLLQEWLTERHGWAERSSRQFAIVIGGHHGVHPGPQRIHDLDLHPELLRTKGPSEATWKTVQFELLDACARAASATDRLDAWRDVKLPQCAQVTLTALVILADWIASSAELFPYVTRHASGDKGAGRQTTKHRLEAAWQGLDLPAPWEPDEPDDPASELFARRFDLPDGATIRPVQEEAVRVAREMDPAGLLIIEAPMAEGKTEAALAAAEILAARTGAGGCMVALPTRATSSHRPENVLEKTCDLPPGSSGCTPFLLRLNTGTGDCQFAARSANHVDPVGDRRQCVQVVGTDAQIGRGLLLSQPGAACRQPTVGKRDLREAVRPGLHRDIVVGGEHRAQGP